MSSVEPIDQESDFTWQAVCCRRLQRHFLAVPAGAEQIADVVGAMSGAHAQILTAAELSIGLRVAGSTRADVRRALWQDRTLVKTFGPRGTVHVLPARDLPLWTGALTAIPSTRGGPAMDQLLTPAQTDEVVAAIASALAETELTVDELTEAVVELAGPWAGDPVMEAFDTKWPRWRAATSEAANRGALCFGPNRGQKITYTNPNRWHAGFAPMAVAEAQAELLRRYLHAYGPATPQHFARWLSSPARWAGELFESEAAGLERVRVEGREAWVNAGDTGHAEEGTGGLRLLPYFDAYAVGSHPRDLLLTGRAGERALTGGQAGNYPVVLIDGTVAGIWHLRRAGRKLHLTVESFVSLSAVQQRQLEEQVARVGAVLEGAPELTMGPVSVGPHA